MTAPLVQRGLVTDFGAGEDTTTDTIGTAVVTANAFARLTNVAFHSAGATAGSGGGNNDDLGCSCLLTDTTTVTLTRYSTGANEDVSVSYEVIEFPASGNDQAIVRMHQDITLADSTSTSDTAVSGVSTIAECVPIICGVRSAATSSAQDRSSCSAQLVDVSGAQIRLTRSDSASAIIVSVAVVEFTGSNWTVEQNILHEQTTIDTVETETVTAVTWAETMIFSSLDSGSDTMQANYCAVWPGATTTTLKFQSGHTAANTYAFLVSNANLTVESIDSLDGSESVIDADGSDPMIVDKTVSASTLADHFVVATAFTTAAGSARTFWGWNYYFTSTTNLRWWNNATGTSTDPDWAAQLIDISGLSAGAAGNPKGPLGMPLHGPLGGPI